MPKLAINGGPKVRLTKFPSNKTIGKEEKEAVERVIDSGILSRFLGTWHEDFNGGPEVNGLEKDWADYFNVKHAIVVNSATSGIYCAVGAVGAGPGDEIIVSPFTMACSAVAPLVYNAIPVFADIEEDYFCLSPESVESKITTHTIGIIVVNIFGQPYNSNAINLLAKKHNLFVIEDNAQGPGAMYKNQYAGTLGDIGVFSLNYHKHIHSGEGGVVVTNNDLLADKIRLIRNHAESVVGAKGYYSLINMIGFNYRMTELEAAIGREQLKKLKDLVEKRIENVKFISNELAKIPCLEPAKTRENSKHVFYLHAIKFNKEIAGIHRDKFIDAVNAELMPTELREAEGVKVNAGYVKPIYLQPLFQEKVVYKNGCPWDCKNYNQLVDYSKGICPVTENLHDATIFTHDLMRPSITKSDMKDVIDAFAKVWEFRNEIK